MFSMQGDEPEDDNKILYTQLKEMVQKAHPIQDFLDYNMITIPKRSEMKDRIKMNYEKYQGNYLIMILVFSCIFICIRRNLLILVALWGCYLYFMKRGEQNFHVRGMVVKKEWIFKGLILFSFCFAIYSYDILFSLMASLSLLTILILIHMLVFFETEEIEEEEEKV